MKMPLAWSSKSRKEGSDKSVGKGSTVQSNDHGSRGSDDATVSTACDDGSPRVVARRARRASMQYVKWFAACDDESPRVLARRARRASIQHAKCDETPRVAAKQTRRASMQYTKSCDDGSKRMVVKQARRASMQYAKSCDDGSQRLVVKQARRASMQPAIYSTASDDGSQRIVTKQARRASMQHANYSTVSDDGSSKVATRSARRSSMKHSKYTNTVNTELVNRWLEYYNKHDIEGFKALSSTSDFFIRFIGAEEAVTIKDIAEVQRAVYRSFPDFSYVGDELREVAPGVVVMKHAIVSGTHTGEPFAFGTNPPIAARGVKCTSDPEQATFWVVKGQIAMIHIHTTGGHAGLIGLYQQAKGG